MRLIILTIFIHCQNRRVHAYRPNFIDNLIRRRPLSSRIVRNPPISRSLYFLTAGEEGRDIHVNHPAIQEENDDSRPSCYFQLLLPCFYLLQMHTMVRLQAIYSGAKELLHTEVRWNEKWIAHRDAALHFKMKSTSRICCLLLQKNVWKKTL